MGELTPQFSANRMMREYVDRIYSGSANRYRRRIADGAEEADRLCRWQRLLNGGWHKLRFGSLDIQRQEDHYLITVTVYLGDIDSRAVQVQVYADPQDDEEPEIHALQIGEQAAGTENGFYYRARIPARRPKEDYTPRIIPCFEGASLPLECAEILWYEKY